MGLFQRNHRDDLKLLKESYILLLDDFSLTFGFDPVAIAEHRPDDLDIIEYYFFFGGFTLASYAFLSKNTDKEAIKSFALWLIGNVIKELYKNKSQESTAALIDKYFDDLAKLLETRQDECIDLLVRDTLKPSGKRSADGLTLKASELIFKGRLRDNITLSSFIMKNFSNFIKLFQN